MYGAITSCAINIAGMIGSAAINTPGDGVVPNISLGSIVGATLVADEYEHEVANGWVSSGRSLRAVTHKDIDEVMNDKEIPNYVRKIVSVAHYLPGTAVNAKTREQIGEYCFGNGRELLAGMTLAYAMSRLRKKSLEK